MTVYELCQKYDMNPTDLARRFDIPARTVQQWYAGDRKVTTYQVNMMEQILDVERRLIQALRNVQVDDEDIDQIRSELFPGNGVNKRGSST